MVLSPSSASTCFARARLLLGQNRVPLPPARITGANRGPALPPAKFIGTNVSGKSALNLKSQNTPASASRPHPPHPQTRHTTAARAHSSQTPPPEPPPHAPPSAASTPGPRLTSPRPSR